MREILGSFGRWKWGSSHLVGHTCGAHLLAPLVGTRHSWPAAPSPSPAYSFSFSPAWASVHAQPNSKSPAFCRTRRPSTSENWHSSQSIFVNSRLFCSPQFTSFPPFQLPALWTSSSSLKLDVFLLGVAKWWHSSCNIPSALISWHFWVAV